MKGVIEVAQKTALPISRQTDPVFRRIRAEQVIKRKIAGYPQEEIAKELNISPATVVHDTRFAKQTGLLDKIESRLTGELGNLAIEVYRKKLIDDEDAFVAKDVLNLISKLGDRKAKTEQVTQTFTIEDYIRSRQNSLKEISEQPAPQPALLGEVIDSNGADSGE